PHADACALDHARADQAARGARDLAPELREAPAPALEAQRHALAVARGRVADERGHGEPRFVRTERQLERNAHAPRPAVAPARDRAPSAAAARRRRTPSPRRAGWSCARAP